MLWVEKASGILRRPDGGDTCVSRGDSSHSSAEVGLSIFVVSQTGETFSHTDVVRRWEYVFVFFGWNSGFLRDALHIMCPRLRASFGINGARCTIHAIRTARLPRRGIMTRDRAMERPRAAMLRLGRLQEPWPMTVQSDLGRSSARISLTTGEDRFH